MATDQGRRWGQIWGLCGVLIFLLSAVWRIFPDMHDVFSEQNGLESYLAVSVLLPMMVYLEGYRGFYKRFTPRVVSRGKALVYQDNLIYQILAPLFCMGFIGSAVRRKLGLTIVTVSIVGLAFWVGGLSQPWRWVVDVSVAVALLFGVVSIIWVAFKDWSTDQFLCDPEVPNYSAGIYPKF
jgi:low affinity Fe/Cu permease